MNFFFISSLLFLPTATVVVAHSPTPSAVIIIASLNGEEKMHLQHDLNDDQKNKYCLF